MSKINTKLPTVKKEDLILIIICESCFEEIKSFPTIAERKAFEYGFEYAAGKYGGDAGAYPLEDYLDELEHLYLEKDTMEEIAGKLNELGFNPFNVDV